MSLVSRGQALLRLGSKLLLSCCDVCFPPKCNRYLDECGNERYRCGRLGPDTVGECNESCVPPEKPCECGPTKPCDPCYECLDGTCVRIEDCCEDGSPCGECEKCVNGQCVPCGPCEQCINGICGPCGPCQICVNGECVPCPEGCVDGVCGPPSQYYCCYDTCPPPAPAYGVYGPDPPKPTAHCQTTPCGYGIDEEGDPCSLHKGGPYPTTISCLENCSKYSCVPDKCGEKECFPDQSGPYDNKSECLGGKYNSDSTLAVQACVDPCALPCAFNGGNGPGRYTIDACEREICVSFAGTNSRPFRVQILGPTLDDNCNIVASSVIKRDSGWRCTECCDCPNTAPRSNDPSACGAPKGKLTWTKPRGVTYFDVVVITACGGGANVDIQCVSDSNDCFDYPTPPECPCQVKADCNQDGGECFCCCNKCRPEPCREDCDEFQDWVLSVTFCGETLTLSAANGGNPEKYYGKGATVGGCCWFGAGDKCSPTDQTLRFVGPGGASGFIGQYFIRVDLFGSILGLFLDNNCASPTSGKCIGHLNIGATAPIADCRYYWCVRSYHADIVDGVLVNEVQGGSVGSPDGYCDCGPGASAVFEVSLSYNQFP